VRAGASGSPALAIDCCGSRTAGSPRSPRSSTRRASPRSGCHRSSSDEFLAKGDVAEYVEALKREEGPEIQVHGSPGLIQTLLPHDVIDEFRMWIFPVALGTGKRLFGDGTIPVALRLVDSSVSKTGVTTNTYARAGEIQIGEMDFEEPTEAELERRQRLAAG
jgi:riboflavin biosynthesis pyrimidine reductase